MAVNFGLAMPQGGGIAEQFAAGQQAAQQNLLAQQQLAHADVQNQMLKLQMAQAMRQESQRNALANLYAKYQGDVTNPKFLQEASVAAPELYPAMHKEVLAGITEQRKARESEATTAAKEAELKKTNLDLFYQKARSAAQNPTDDAIKRIAADAVKSGFTDMQDATQMQTAMLALSPQERALRLASFGLPATEAAKQFTPTAQYLNTQAGFVPVQTNARLPLGPIAGAPTVAMGVSPYQQAQLAQGQARLAQGAARLGISAAEADPFGVLGLPRSFGTGLPAQPSVNALTAPQPVTPAAAPAAAAAVPAKSVSVSNQPATTAVQTAIQQGLTGPEFLAALPAPVAKEVAAIIDHRAPPPGRFTKKGEQLTQLVMQADPTYDATQYGNKAAAEKKFTSGPLADSIRSFNVAQDHLSTLGELSAALKNNDTQAFNRLSQFIAQQTGSPAPTNFDAAKRIVADEIVKAVIGGRGALGDRKAADETLSRVNSPEQLMGVIDTYKKLINGQLGGLEKQYETATGKTNFKARFLTQAASGAKPATGGIPQAAIDALKAGKGTDAQFDEIFGAGAAARARGQ